MYAVLIEPEYRNFGLINLSEEDPLSIACNTLNCSEIISSHTFMNGDKIFQSTGKDDLSAPAFQVRDQQILYGSALIVHEVNGNLSTPHTPLIDLLSSIRFGAIGKPPFTLHELLYDYHQRLGVLSAMDISAFEATGYARIAYDLKGWTVIKDIADNELEIQAMKEDVCFKLTKEGWEQL